MYVLGFHSAFECLLKTTCLYYELEQSERRLAALDFEDRENLGPAGPGLEAGYVGEVVVGIPVEDGMLV